MNVQGFIDAMRIFGDPKVPNGMQDEDFFGAYHRGLARFSAEALELAAEQMLATREKRTFPLPAECLAMCRDAQDEISLRDEGSLARRPASDRYPEWSPERVAAADRMMSSEIGRLAASEGWIIHLHDWCRENSRLPTGSEQKKVQAKGLAIKMERERMATMPEANTRMVAAIGDAIRVKQAKLTRLTYGKDAS